MRKLVLGGLMLGIAGTAAPAYAGEGAGAAVAGAADRGVSTTTRSWQRSGTAAQRSWGRRSGGRWWAGSSAPGGWGGYRRPAAGFVLPSYWINRDYYLGDYGYYGLPAPAAGYGWSRYYDDAVLTDRYGRVVDARYGYDWDRYGRYDDDDVYEDRHARRDHGGDTALGAVAGGAVGAVAGSAIAGRGNRTAGALVGAGVGAVAGAAIADSAGRRDRREGYADDVRGRRDRDGGYRSEGYRADGYRADGYRGRRGDDRAQGYEGEWVGTWYGRDGSRYDGSYDGRFEGAIATPFAPPPPVLLPPVPYAPLSYGAYGGYGAYGVGYGQSYASGSYVEYAPVTTVTTEVVEETSYQATARKTYRKPRVVRAKALPCSCRCVCN